ncbi:hypothetical protein GCM10017673_38290 [Streptosporangium violaceochromogenes]|nr:hypothetical protein GCM10017673_38290 [Streptosporangium violaceochromogenes]
MAGQDLWEYVFYDWDTHVPIDALPLQGVTFGLGLGATGQLTASIPLYDDRYNISRVTAATLPERTICVIFRDRRYVGAYRMIDPQDYDSATGVMSITGEELPAILAYRFVNFTGPRTATPYDEVRFLLEHAADPADARWMPAIYGSGGTGTVTRAYRREEFMPILDQVGEVTAVPNAFDWWCRPEWDTAHDRPAVAVKGVGRQAPEPAGLVLEYPGNVERYGRKTRRGLLTRVHGRLQTDTAGTVIETVDRPGRRAAGYPLIEQVFQIDSATSRQDLIDQLTRIADTAAGPKLLFDWELGVGAATQWWGWELGTYPRCLVTDYLYPALPDGSAGLDRPMQLVGVEVTPQGDDGERLKVTTGEFTQATV